MGVTILAGNRVSQQVEARIGEEQIVMQVQNGQSELNKMVDENIQAQNNGQVQAHSIEGHHVFATNQISKNKIMARLLDLNESMRSSNTTESRKTWTSVASLRNLRQVYRGNGN